MTNKIIKIGGLIFLIVGIAILVISFSYHRYTNEQEYQDKYLSISGLENASDQFYKLRAVYLTPKYILENYGITFIITGIMILTISTIGLNRLKTPDKKLWITIIGISAALLTIIGYIGDLFLEMYRDSNPHWADSLGIPLMGVPFLILLSLAWVGVNLIGMKGEFMTNVAILPFNLDNINYWYGIMLVITSLLTLVMVVSGSFWQIISGFLWIYFYISILIGIKQAKI